MKILIKESTLKNAKEKWLEERKHDYLTKNKNGVMPLGVNKALPKEKQVSSKKYNSLDEYLEEMSKSYDDLVKILGQ